MKRLSKAISQLDCSNFSLIIDSIHGQGHFISDKDFLSLLKALEFNKKLRNFTFVSYVSSELNYMENDILTSLGKRWLNLLYANPNLNITFKDWEQLNNLNIQNQRFAAMGHQIGDKLSSTTNELLALIRAHPHALLNFTHWLLINIDLDDIERNTFCEVINQIVNEVPLPMNIRSMLYTLTRETWLADDALNQYELTVEQWLRESNFKLYCRNLIDGSFYWLTNTEEELNQYKKDYKESIKEKINRDQAEDSLNATAPRQPQQHATPQDLDNIGEEIKNFINLIIGYNKECIPSSPISQPLIDLLFPFMRNVKYCATTSALLEPDIARHYLSNIQKLAQTLEKMMPKKGKWSEASNQQEASTSIDSVLGTRPREESHSETKQKSLERPLKIQRTSLNGDTSSTIWKPGSESVDSNSTSQISSHYHNKSP